MSYNFFARGQQKKEEERRKKIVGIINKILNILSEEKVGLSEMTDIFISLQSNHNRMLLEEIEKLKK